jgi:hypothetical protein
MTNMTRLFSWTLGLALGATLLPAGLRGQDPRLERRLDAVTRIAVEAIIDSASAEGLPAEPLIDRALEGAAKRAPPERIIGAVRTLAHELALARGSLGTASAAELEAGAAALRAGVPGTDLAALRRRRAQSLTVALAALTDLVTSGVPPDSAAAAVLALAASARDDQILEFRRAVERDIALGAPPAAAASVRVDATLHAAIPNSLQPPSPRKP